MAVEAVLLIVGGFALVGWLIVRAAESWRRWTQAYQLVQQYRTHPDVIAALLGWTGCCYIETLNGKSIQWCPFILIVRQTEIEIHDYGRNATEQRIFAAEQLRWFGRPEKYMSGDNETWLHFETNSSWQLVRVWLTKGQTMEFIRALKQITSDELITAYRRRRPYVHLGPAQAFPATQDIHGAWTLAPPVQLYLMPRYIVILDEQNVLRKIALEAVQDIGAIRRLDAPSGGLVRFRAEEVTFAFAVEHYEAFALSLAEAAKRTLEMPVERKSKSKDDDEQE